MSAYNIGVQIRLNRLFSQDKAFVVAGDHRTTIGPQKGLVTKRIGELVAAHGLNGLIIRPAMARYLSNLSLRDTCLMMYLTGKLDRGVDHVMFNTVEYAVSCGADIVCSEFKFGSAGDLGNTHDCSRISEKAHMLGIPHLITTYVQKEQLEHMGECAYAHACAICEELGADIVKIGLPNDAQIMRSCVESVDVPVLMAGGAQDDLEVLSDKVSLFMENGGKGVVMGRNVWGADDQNAVVARLKKAIY